LSRILLLLRKIDFLSRRRLCTSFLRESLILYSCNKIRRHAFRFAAALWSVCGVDGIDRTGEPGVKPRSLKIGQRVLIPALKDAPLNVAAANAEKPSIDAALFSAVYVVQKGETLWSIASKYSVSPEVLAAVNDMGVNDTLPVGKILKTPKN
jgi:hypothetical protein